MLTTNEIKFLKSLSSKRARGESGLFVAEGDKLVGELCELFEVGNIYRAGENCSEAQMQRISQLKTPTSVLATFRIPKYSIEESLRHTGRVLLLDGVQDPGNLGTIIRSCDWFGVRRIVCSMDTADAFSPKVVQATMGAIGRVEIIYTDITEWLEKREALFPGSSFGTFLERSEDYSAVDYPQCATIVMGNEGKGISSAVESRVSRRVHIARGVGGAGESLNVAIAASLLLSRL